MARFFCRIHDNGTKVVKIAQQGMLTDKSRITVEVPSLKWEKRLYDRVAELEEPGLYSMTMTFPKDGFIFVPHFKKLSPRWIEGQRKKLEQGRNRAKTSSPGVQGYQRRADASQGMINNRHRELQLIVEWLKDMKTVEWGRSEDGYVESKCGRFHISPLFIGRTTAQGYKVDDTETGNSYGGPDFTQKMCKEWAQKQTDPNPAPLQRGWADLTTAELMEAKRVLTSNIRVLGSSARDAAKLKEVNEELKNRGVSAPQLLKALNAEKFMEDFVKGPVKEAINKDPACSVSSYKVEGNDLSVTVTMFDGQQVKFNVNVTRA